MIISVEVYLLASKIIYVRFYANLLFLCNYAYITIEFLLTIEFY